MYIVERVLKKQISALSCCLCPPKKSTVDVGKDPKWIVFQYNPVR